MRRQLVGLVIWALCSVSYAQGDESEPTILVWGDSLAAAFGIPIDDGWVAGMQRRLAEQGYPHRVVNASISGETSKGGRNRLPAALDRHNPALLLIELGANDGLRGLSPKQLDANLTAMVTAADERGAEVLLFEMRIPPNYGAAYADAFRQTFHDVAGATSAQLVPFFLADIATDPAMFLDDGIHPSAAAQPILLDAIWPHVVDALMPAGNADESNRGETNQ